MFHHLPLLFLPGSCANGVTRAPFLLFIIYLQLGSTFPHVPPQKLTIGAYPPQRFLIRVLGPSPIVFSRFGYLVAHESRVFCSPLSRVFGSCGIPVAPQRSACFILVFIFFLVLRSLKRVPAGVTLLVFFLLTVAGKPSVFHMGRLVSLVSNLFALGRSPGPFHFL